MNFKCLIFASIVFLGSLSQVESKSIDVGVNVVHPERLNPDQRNDTLNNLQDAKVTTIRVGLINTSSIKFIHEAFLRHIKTVLVVHLEFRAGAKLRYENKDYPGVWSINALSDADPVYFAEVVKRDLKLIDDLGIRLEAFEIGNEINHPAFNGDFNVPGRGIVFGLSDLKTDPEGKKIAQGFRAYFSILQVMKNLRSDSSINLTTPIVSAGLADPGLPGPHHISKLDTVSASATLEYLRTLGLDQVVDGYGIHVYVGDEPQMSVSQRVSDLHNDALAECGPSTKPCWITEWGVSSKQLNSRKNELEREKIVRVTKESFIQVGEGRVASILYYPWSIEPWSHGDDGSEIFRDNKLTPSGILAISPIH